MAAHWPHEPDENSIAAHLNATTRRRRTDWKAASRQWPAFEARLRQLGYRPRAIAHAFRILSGPETVAEALERADHQSRHHPRGFWFVARAATQQALLPQRLAAAQRKRAHAPGPGACETVVTADGPVAVLCQSFAGGKQTYTCREPSGRPVYVVGISNECSTVPGDHPGFGDTPAQLESCARTGFDGASGTASIDGRQVDDYRALISRTTVFTIHLPNNNIFDTKERTARSAAFGEGLLLRGLSSGTHIIHTTSVVPNVFSAEVTYTLRVG